jgi:hypothetical protein
MESCSHWTVVDGVKLYDRIHSKLQSPYRGTIITWIFKKLPSFLEPHPQKSDTECHVKWIQRTHSNLISLTYMLILSLHLCWRFQSNMFLSDFQTEIFRHFRSTSACCIHHPSHSPWFDHPLNTSWRAEFSKLLIMQFSPSSCYILPLWGYIIESPLMQAAPRALYVA